MSGSAQQHGSLPSASSSSHSPPSHSHTPLSDDRDELDFLDDADLSRRDQDHDYAHDRTVLDDDPIRSTLSTPLSFKRRQKSAASGPSRIFSAFLQPSSSTSSLPDHASATASAASSAAHHHRPRPLGSFASGSSPPQDALGIGAATASKDGAPLDWYVEGPGRRVGYENLTAIDWIFEYTKERQRMRVLSSSGRGIVNYVNQLLDASQVWVVLLLTGLAVGTIAAVINVTTDWLGDLKLGYCSSGPEGGHFYLNRNFCCYGYDRGSHCVGWNTWGEALGASAAAGRWTVGYIFFTLFSVFLAYCAALFVQEYGIYAKHSGIPEIKTVLGGFVIRGFFSTWTLITKSLGLVSYTPLSIGIV
jgi:chloride channel 3/4/5